MADIEVQMEGIVEPTYNKRRKGYVFKEDGMEVFIKGEDKDVAMKQMAELMEKQEKDDDDIETHSFAEGGYEDGGLKDEGGSVDPVSGNDVPVGSTQTEVRDDIPAQLSEGEFVLPADVVRYIGLENLMELRNKAKQGLQQMEAMGQMGNSEEAVMDDTADMDVDIDSLIEEFDPNDPETLNFAEGGMPTYQYEPQQNIYSPTSNFNPYTSQTGQQQQFSYGYMPQTTYTPPPIPSANASQFTSAQQGGGRVEQRQYQGPNGELRTFTFIDGKPTEEIPAGFKVYKPEEVTPQVAKPQVQQVSTSGGGGGGEGSDYSSPPSLGYSREQAVGVLGEIDSKLQERYDALPDGVIGVLKNGLIPSAIKAVQYGVTERNVINQLEQGYGLGTKPTGEYGAWRSNLDNVYMAASVLESENEAREVARTGDIGGSSFGSRDEAEAVAEHGWGSDEHIDAIESKSRDLPTTTGGDDSWMSRDTSGGDGGGGVSAEESQAAADNYGTTAGSEQSDMLAEQDRGLMDDDDGDSGSDSGGSYCCTKMVDHELWKTRREFAMMHKWHREQPQWWRDGYDVWGNVIAETLLKNNHPFWTSVMQSFYDHHVKKQPHTLKSRLANVIIYPGVAVYGLIAKVTGKHINAV